MEKTVTASLKLFDGFSNTLRQAQQQVERALAVAVRFRRSLSEKVRLNVDTREAMNRLRQVQQEIGGIRAQIKRHSSGETVRIRMSLNTTHALTLARQLRAQIAAKIGTIAAPIQATLSSTLTELLSNLLRSAEQLVSAGQSLTQSIATGSAAQLRSVLQRIAWLERQNLALVQQKEASKQPSASVIAAPSSSSGASSAVSPFGSILGEVVNTFQGITSFRDIPNMLLGLATIENVQKVIDISMSGAMNEQTIKDTFIARTGDAEMGTSMFNKFKSEALQAGDNVTESLNGTLSLFSATRDTDQLSKLNSLASQMSYFDKDNKGIGGAASALKAAMSGNAASLAASYNIPKEAISKFNIEELGKSGNTEASITALQQLLESQNMGKKAADTMSASPVHLLQGIDNQFKNSMATAGQSALQTLTPLIQQAFQAGSFEPFFQALSASLQFVSMLIVGLANAATWLGNVVQSNWDIIISIIAGIGAALLANAIPSIWATIVSWWAMIPALWAAIPPLYAQVAAWMAINWPLVLIGILVAGLVYALIQFGVTGDQVVGFIAGAFMMLVGQIWNQIALLWNIFASFAEFLINLFIDPIYAVQKLFYDLAKTFGGLMYTMLLSAEGFAGGFMSTILEGINAILKGFNWLSNAIKDMTGVDIGQAKMFDTANVNAMSDGIKTLLDQMKEPISNEAVITIPRMDMKNLKNEFDYGYNAGAGFANDVSGLFKLPGTDSNQDVLNKWNLDNKNLTVPAGLSTHVNRVDEVGTINDTVDISSEDLKVMRELSDIQNIQNFVTLTPTVQVTTGDINQPTDVNEMIRQIEEVMVREVANSAQRVYS